MPVREAHLRKIFSRLHHLHWRKSAYSTVSAVRGTSADSAIVIEGKSYDADEQTNVTPHLLGYTERRLHLQRCHPIQLLKRRVADYFGKRYVNRRGNPVFSVYDTLSPVVTLEQNFDSLLVPKSHPSRNRSDSYYLNRSYMLRAHTSAHQRDLVRAGLDAFLVAGDVYRRDEIDRNHYPVFHQMEGVRLFSADQLFAGGDPQERPSLFEVSGRRDSMKQASHTLEAAKLLEHSLKTCLIGLAEHLFGDKMETRWVPTTFPFTHPSWELEARFKDDWLELLGCGIMEQRILQNAGADEKVGWAFGLGLERIAMKLYNIPDIRAFWSTDPGFLAQFDHDDPYREVNFKMLSSHPPCTADMSFWVPDGFSVNDYFDLVRNVGGDLVERVETVDVFTHPKTHRTSFCFRIVYRHMERTLTQEDANAVHRSIGSRSQELLGVELRIK